MFSHFVFISNYFRNKNISVVLHGSWFCPSSMSRVNVAMSADSFDDHNLEGAATCIYE